MDIIPVVTLLLSVVGFLIVCFFTFKVKDDESIKIETNNIENYLDRINQSISDADALVNELDSFSKNIKQELDTKYDEVLYLYTMVNEKKLEVLDLVDKKEIKTDVSKHNVNQADMLKEYLIDNKLEQAKTFNNDLENNFNMQSSNLVYQKLDNLSRNEEIITLFDKGFPIGEIAKKLNIGFGEVKLIVDLSRKQAVL